MLKGRLGFGVLAATVLLAAASATSAQVIRVGPEFQINAFTADGQSDSSVDIAVTGNFVVVWTSAEQDGDGYGVFGRRFNSAGVAQGVEFQVNQVTMSYQFEPAVGIADSGSFVVTWESYAQDGSAYGIFARRFDANGVGSPTFQVTFYSTFNQTEPEVAVGANGDFVIAWQSDGEDGDDTGIFARRFDSAGALIGSTFQVNFATAGGQYGAKLGHADDGSFVVVWSSTGDGDSTGVFARRFDSTGAALDATDVLVNTFTEGQQTDPNVDMDGAGNFVVVWASYNEDGDGLGIFARSFDSAGTPGAVFPVNTTTAGQQAEPAVKTGGGVGFGIAWSSANQDGDGGTVIGRRFDSGGSPLGPEVIINTYTVGDQSLPAVGLDSSNRFVITWQSNEQDGDKDGIFAQRLAKLGILDIDGDGSIQPLTDGLLVLRYEFGFTGATLITGAVNLSGCTRCDSPTIEAYLQTLY